MVYLLIVLFSAAITLVFVRGSLFAQLRTHGPDLWREFSNCSLCVGVWIGAGATFLAGSRGLLPVGFPVLFTALGLGSLAGAAALLYVRIIDALEIVLVEGEARVDFWAQLPKLTEQIMQKLAEEEEKKRQERAQIRAERREQP